MIVAVDIGGTFTDLAAVDPDTGELRFSKSLTTPPHVERGALDCINLAEIAPADIRVLRHGTTVVINALLERKGARTALITTEGFRDILEIGRGNRPESFNLFYERLPPMVPRIHRFELAERMDARGNVVRPLDGTRLPELVERLRGENIDSIAICFLHAWRNPAHEKEVADYLRGHGDWFVSASHELSREFREYERTVTTVLNAYVGPAASSYLHRLDDALRGADFSGRISLMGSNGGMLTADDTTTRPILLVESGPVGGVAGAIEVGRRMGLDNLVAFDMGGTTAKAVLVEDGEAAVSPLYWVGGYERGYPVQAAVLDIVEVGAGGGSIASINELGSIQVGPQSAGAVPGPACYDRGGDQPTVTDANLLLGRLDENNFLGGTMRLRRDLSEAAIGRLGQQLGQETEPVAAGILKLATLTMASTVRKVTIERGHDPRDFAMVAFGGAGPLHAVDVAREIGMRKVIIPPQPGHFSAYGMLFADYRVDLTETIALPLETFDLSEMDRRFGELATSGEDQLEAVGPVRDVRHARYAEMRYRGQEYTLKVRLPPGAIDRAELEDIFHAGYRRRYGNASRSSSIDVVTLRMVTSARSERSAAAFAEQPATAARPARRTVWFEETGAVPCVVVQRGGWGGEKLAGPALIEEQASTTVLPPGWTAFKDEFGNIIIEANGQS